MLVFLSSLLNLNFFVAELACVNAQRVRCEIAAGDQEALSGMRLPLASVSRALWKNNYLLPKKLHKFSRVAQSLIGIQGPRLNVLTLSGLKSFIIIVSRKFINTSQIADLTEAIGRLASSAEAGS